MVALNDVIAQVTANVIERSKDTRREYLQEIERRAAEAAKAPASARLQCSNFAHAIAAADKADQNAIAREGRPVLGVVTAYNDMLSAHAPYADYPKQIKAGAKTMGWASMVAGATPAMCDGVTQGTEGMQLSLLSREVIAQSTAVATSHNVFKAVALLGICDKIVPGLVIGMAKAAGHLPGLFIPSGPMKSGISNTKKKETRELYALGKVDRQALMDSERDSYHGLGTCTFHGTANTNQMMMEVMGLQLPGSSFINPDSVLRKPLTKKAVQMATELKIPFGQMVDEKTFVNAVVALLATGGSTNVVMHLIAMAGAFGIRLTLEDFDAISKVVPLISGVYPNGLKDINAFQAAGGMPFVIGQLLDGGFLHPDVSTITGEDLNSYRMEPVLTKRWSRLPSLPFFNKRRLEWRMGASETLDREVLRPVTDPFRPEGGIKLIKGEVGPYSVQAIMKTSAVQPENLVIEAEARVFNSQTEMLAAFDNGELFRDMIAVVRFEGVRSAGMPEMHKLIEMLGALKRKGHKVALITDGRLSGASGAIPAAIHAEPEAEYGGLLSRIRNGDVIRLDGKTGRFELVNVTVRNFVRRRPVTIPENANFQNQGHELFDGMRAQANLPSQGATTFKFRALQAA